METELLPGVSLTFDQNIAGDAERFRHAFLSTWGLMPMGIRRVLESHWNKQPSGPLIEYVPFEWNREQGNIAGRVLNRGYNVQFNHDVFTRCEPEQFQTAIAHELSHIFFIAQNQPQHIFIRPYSQDKLTTELLAFELTRRMGFQQDRFFEWINCSMSKQGPFLRAERGEKDWSPDEFWNRWRALETQWQRAFHPDKSLDEAKAELYAEHDALFKMALEE